MLDQIKAYFDLTEKQREIIRYLYVAEIKRRKKKFFGVFPSVARLAYFANCSIRTVIRFNKRVCPDIIVIQDRKRPNMSTTTNQYHFVKEFFEAMAWLDKRNLLYDDPKVFESIKRQFENHSVTPPSRGECHPHSLTLSQTHKEYRYVHPMIEKIGISLEAKIRLSAYPEHAIIKGLEDAAWWWRQGNRPRKNLDAVVTERIKAHYVREKG